MKKHFGSESTNLILTDKAQRYYDGATPFDIYETETDGEYAYTIKAFGDPESAPMTSAELIQTLEAMADEEARLFE